MQSPELLAPAGSFDTARAAIAAGADAVYLGLDAYSARAEAVNFSVGDLRLLLAHAHELGRKVYVTFNTLLENGELPDAVERLAILDELRPDGLIVQDLGVARIVRKHFPSLALHASTQLVAHNLEGVLALAELGFSRVVLARELSLDEIRSITRRCGVEIEVFVHGALCYSISGLCLFSAMEKQRSGNRGRCAYCCRLAYTDATGTRAFPFSMRDLRLDDSIAVLKEAGVASLKIEGRMKSALYVASATRHYREILDGLPPTVSRADLETVFSRRTTSLYIDGAPGGHEDDRASSVIDPTSLGHLGTPVGTVKRLTKDREGRTWLRFHTDRALERHDGLQFAAADGGKPYGFGIDDMRVAISRSTVFAIPAGSDVEVRIPDEMDSPAAQKENPILPGVTVYCSSSNAVKRRFPIPPFRPSDVESGTTADITVTLAGNGITARCDALSAEAHVDTDLSPALHPERTVDAIRKAFSRLGGTSWKLGNLSVVDPNGLFAPASALNDLRRRLVDLMDAGRDLARSIRTATVLDDIRTTEDRTEQDGLNVLKMRISQTMPSDTADYDEIVFAVGHKRGKDIRAMLSERCEEIRSLAEAAGTHAPAVRLALPVFTHENDFGAMRAAVKHLLGAGCLMWEVSDLATLRMLRSLGIDDITADWTLYAANAAARAQLSELGVKRQVMSPEFPPFATAGQISTEFLVRQTTPLFISLTRPAVPDPSKLTGLTGDTFVSYRLDGLWITARPEPRRFQAPPDSNRRIDISWDK